MTAPPCGACSGPQGALAVATAPVYLSPDPPSDMPSHHGSRAAGPVIAKPPRDQAATTEPAAA